MMNKDLPIIIQKVFTNPDPIIWRGIWIVTLKLLLNNKRMVKVWIKLLSIIKSNHKFYPNLQLNQYIKWEFTHIRIRHPSISKIHPIPKC